MFIFLCGHNSRGPLTKIEHAINWLGTPWRLGFDDFFWEITKSSKTLPILQNHAMTYNIILLLFTISSILKCQFLNHTQPLYEITISSICRL